MRAAVWNAPNEENPAAAPAAATESPLFPKERNYGVLYSSRGTPLKRTANHLISRHGIDFDSSVLIDAERQRQNARPTLESISAHAGASDSAIPVVTLIEFLR
jgi:hypothetical protein